MAVIWKITGSVDPSAVATISLTAAGTGYTSAPTVSLSGGGGSGATATASIPARGVASIAVGAGGLYTSAPTVALTGGGGSGATATAALASTGGVYSAGAISDPGGGWVTGDRVSLTGPGGSGAVAEIIATAGQVTGFTIISAGSGYTSITGYSVISGTPYSGFLATFNVGYPIASFSVTAAGSGYTSAPSVGLSGGGGSGGGTGTAALASTGVSAITLTNPGTGYTTPPSVGFSGGGGSGATADATLAGMTFDETPLDEAGITGLVRVRRSLARDEVRFRVEGRACDAAVLFGYGREVTIKRVEDSVETVWFVGRVIETRTGGSAAGEFHEYRAAGPWWYFENLVYQQIWPLDASANSHLTSPTTYRRALAIVGLASSTGLRQNTKDFLVDLLEYLIASNSPAVIAYTGSELPTGFNVPFTRLDAPTCAEAVRWVCRWMPDAASWFDYSVSPPKLNLQRRSGASTVSFALSVLQDVQINPRPDLKLDKLIVQFVTLNASGVVVLNEDKDPSGAGTTGKEWGSAVITIDNNYLAIPTGLAANYRAGLSTLQYAGSFAIEEEECAQTVHPGHLVNITGGLTAWATMAAQVQEVIEEIDTGRTTVVVGPPEHIQINDLVEILRIARNQADEFGGSGEILKSGNGAKNQVITQALTVAGVVPTSAEITTALESAYSGKPKPRSGDIVHLTVSGVVRFRVNVHTLSSTTSAWAIVTFSVSSKTYYGHVNQTGIYG